MLLESEPLPASGLLHPGPPNLSSFAVALWKLGKRAGLIGNLSKLRIVGNTEFVMVLYVSASRDEMMVVHREARIDRPPRA